LPIAYLKQKPKVKIFLSNSIDDDEMCFEIELSLKISEEGSTLFKFCAIWELEFSNEN